MKAKEEVYFGNVFVPEDIEKNGAKYEKEYKKKHPTDKYKKLSDVVKNPEVDFEIGDKIIVTNGYGVKFLRKIIGFTEPTKYGGCILLNWDCWWFPVKPSECELLTENTVFEC